MLAIIASDNQTISTKLRHAIVQLGYDCPIENVYSVDEGSRFLETTDQQPNLVMFGVPEDEDRSLTLLQRFNELTSARIIAVGPGSDPRVILNAVHSGADDFLDENQDLYEQLSSFLNRLTAKRETASPNGRMTVVTSAGGGCGTSIVACNLAVLIARERESCALLDFDTRSGDQAALFNLKPRHSLAELCHNIDGCDQKMLEQSLTAHDSGVRLLAASQRLADNRHLSFPAMRRIARIARSTMSDVVIDLGGSADGGDIELLQSADRIVVVFRRDFPALRRMRLMLEMWGNAKIEDDAVQLVANSCGQAKRLSIAKIQSALRRDVLQTLPDDRQGLNVSIDSGNPIVLESPRSPFSRSVKDLGALSGLLAKSRRRVRKARKPGGVSLISKMSFWKSQSVEVAVAPAYK